MAYLDVSPMMTSLRTAPEDFEISDGWLHHIPSRHDFRFDPNGNVQLRAQCDCAQLAIQPNRSVNSRLPTGTGRRTTGAPCKSTANSRRTSAARGSAKS
jgi:hypothetical protein